MQIFSLVLYFIYFVLQIILILLRVLSNFIVIIILSQ